MRKYFLCIPGSLLILFSIQAQDLLLGDFETGLGRWATWGAPLSAESNPDTTGNHSDSVALLDQTAAAWSGMVLWNDPSIITAAYEKISLDVYTKNTGGKIKLQLDNSASGAANFEREVIVPANTWTTVEFDISALTAYDYKQIAFQSDVADFIYFDNIKLIAVPVIVPDPDTYVLTNFLIGTTAPDPNDFSANVNTSWDADSIYITVNITDDILNKSAPNAWERDMVEIYFDLDNSKQDGAYDSNDKEMSFIWNTDNSALLNGKAKSVQENTATGWKIKISVPFSAIMAGFVPEIGKLIGFDVHADDNDGAATRDTKLSWMAIADEAWPNTSYMGTIKLLANGQVEPIYPVPPVIETNMVFIHPGAVNGKADLDFAKEMIVAGKQPWTKAFNQMKGMAKGGASPMEWIDSHDDAGDAAISKDDALKTYANALTWYFTGQEIYAKQAIALLNAWSILQGFNNGTDQDKLHAGWIGSLFGPAAEIMRAYPGWAAADMAKVQEMFRRAYYPQLKTVSTWNGNVDLAQIEALMNIAVFNEDSVEFYQGIKRLQLRNPAYFYLAADPGSSRNYGGSSYPGSWSAPTKWVDGITQETCRDNNHHAQFALASAIHAAEVAWNQGIDIYTENTERYTAAMELMATQMLTGKMQGTCTDDNATTNIFDTWEMGYYHYHHRKGLSLPNSEAVIKDLIRVKGTSQLNIFYETLTHADPSIFLTDINEVFENIEISVYPNPSNNGIFRINKEKPWEVFNSIGTRVIKGYGNTINLSDQSKGLYLVKAENSIIKIIIN
jgi:hypothetical protein